MTLNSVAHALKARRVGKAWIARCPVHDDRNPSLSLDEKDGTVLVYCHAGCDQQDVIDALKERGIWEPGTRSDYVSNSRIVATYQYTDESGNPLYEIVRKEPGKKFLQRYPDGRSGYIWKKHSHQVLYHLPEVLEAPIVFVVEGEKDAETLRSHGFVATTNAGGAEAPWLPQFTEALRGREVILIPDNDAPGKRRVLTIARALVGYAAKIIILELEDAKDVTEWLARGHSELDLIAQVEGEAVG